MRFMELAGGAAVAAAILSNAGLAPAQDRIITDRPPKPEVPPAEITPRNQGAVQIHGHWVADLSQCRAAMDDDPGGYVYLTDTLLRWGQQTCSIRDVSKTAQGALVDAMCVSDQGRQRTTFTLSREAPDRMTIVASNGLDTASVIRCP